MTFKSELAQWLTDLLQGKFLQHEVTLGIEVSTTSDKSLEVEVAWGFSTLGFLESEQQDECPIDESTLHKWKHEGIVYKGLWRRAEQVFPPKGCLRVTQRTGERATMKNGPRPFQQRCSGKTNRWTLRSSVLGRGNGHWQPPRASHGRCARGQSVTFENSA